MHFMSIFSKKFEIIQKLDKRRVEVYLSYLLQSKENTVILLAELLLILRKISKACIENSALIFF